ncbi:AraC-type DNA-binding protein [Shimia gijangensis]|uniref:AraC-type DNA-binding protein n=1 Tax=Shimia gijangensis TaxID=1470563 RepID=A0A1M6E3L2_9RHOB|nr:helix-turn-helix transcriptional regulator [Shimia gijangensis]SHI80092.1 AraC-type DNA-binding protein [Shimia gijangensis]
MRDRNSTSCFVRKVRLIVSNRLCECPPSPGMVAGEMSLTKRTLQRRLSEEGTNFSTLLDEVRCEKAHAFLLDGGRDMGQLAKLLGYKQQSTLTRAFHRWTGASPTNSLKQMNKTKTSIWREKVKP